MPQDGSAMRAAIIEEPTTYCTAAGWRARRDRIAERAGFTRKTLYSRSRSTDASVPLCDASGWTRWIARCGRAAPTMRQASARSARSAERRRRAGARSCRRKADFKHRNGNDPGSTRNGATAPTVKGRCAIADLGSTERNHLAATRPRLNATGAFLLFQRKPLAAKIRAPGLESRWRSLGVSR
jgi:hypothetical protein